MMLFDYIINTWQKECDVWEDIMRRWVMWEISNGLEYGFSVSVSINTETSTLSR